VPRMSTALLSKRLKELEAAGIITREVSPGNKQDVEYKLTEAGRDVRGVVETIGVWGQRWVETKPSLDNLDVGLLMWDMRRNLKPDWASDVRQVIEFGYTDLPASQKRWWVIIEPDGSVDLCSVDPGFEVDLMVSVDLRTMTSIWMGLSCIDQALKDQTMSLDGEASLAKSMQAWLGLSPFAPEPKRV